MKKYYLVLIAIVLIISSCNESINESDPENKIEEETNYSTELNSLFPAEVGDSFDYFVDTLNFQSNKFENIGSRKVYVQEKETTSNIYFCSEQYEILNSIFQSQSKFRINENSIEFFYDSTGVTDLIPDSVDFEIQLIFDESFNLVQYPLEKDKKWSAFKAGANFGTFKFTLFSITGEYLGSEVIQLDGFESTTNTEKFKYVIDLSIPDLNNPFISNNQQYSATVWFSPDIGMVKLEGSGMFVNTITGRSFDIADSNKVIRHSLINN